MNASEEIIVGLDIGTTKVCAVAGIKRENGLEIIGVGQSPSHGLHQGMVTNIESTASAIRMAINEVKLMSGHEVKNVVVGIADKFIRSQNSNGIVTIKHSEVTEQDVERVIESALTIATPPDRKILHVITREFLVDDQDEIAQPLALSGSRLEVRTHIVTSAASSIKNIIKACNRSELDVSKIVLQSLASAEAVIMPEEQQLGVALIDIGGGTTDIAVTVNGVVIHVAEIPIAGNHFSSDLSVALGVVMNEGERIKIQHGCCWSEMVGRLETVEIATSGYNKYRQIPKIEIAAILQAKAIQLFSMIANKIFKSVNRKDIAAGAIITGGSSLLPGLDKLAEEILEMEVRIGRPLNVHGLKDMICQPVYSTGVGLVLYEFRNHAAPSTTTHVNKSWSNLGVVKRAKNIWKEFV